MRVAKNKHYIIEKVRNGNEVNVHITIVDDNFSLFRYRPINKHTIEQFINDDLFATCSIAFNDPYDATVKFSAKRIKSHIKDRFLKNKSLLKKLLIIYNLKENQLNKLVNLLYSNVLSPNTRFDNNIYALACFSTDITQEIMWAHYADLATGFAVEYDYNNLCELSYEHQMETNAFAQQLDFLKEYLSEEEIIERPLLPVIYTNEKYDVSDIYIEYINLFLDKIEKEGTCNLFNLLLEMSAKNRSKEKVNFFMQNVYCRKKMPWNYENEWRLICYNNSVFLGQLNSNFVNVGKIVPKAVYLGEKISEYDKNAIANIAFKKGIDVFIMQTVIVGNTLKLRPKKISSPL